MKKWHAVEKASFSLRSEAGWSWATAFHVTFPLHRVPLA